MCDCVCFCACPRVCVREGNFSVWFIPPLLGTDLRPGGGGGEYFHKLCMHIGYVPQERPPFFSPEFPFRSISFSQITKINLFRSITILHFFGGFCRSGDHHIQNFFNFNPFIASHGRLSPNAKRSAAPRVSGRSGDSHFHAQNGSSSFRSPAFSRSKRLKLVPGAPHFQAQNDSSSFRSPTFSRSTGSSFRSPCPFSLCRGTYLPKFGIYATAACPAWGQSSPWRCVSSRGPSHCCPNAMVSEILRHRWMNTNYIVVIKFSSIAGFDQWSRTHE